MYRNAKGGERVGEEIVTAGSETEEMGRGL